MKAQHVMKFIKVWCFDTATVLFLAFLLSIGATLLLSIASPILTTDVLSMDQPELLEHRDDVLALGEDAKSIQLSIIVLFFALLIAGSLVSSLLQGGAWIVLRSSAFSGRTLMTFVKSYALLTIIFGALFGILIKIGRPQTTGLVTGFLLVVFGLLYWMSGYVVQSGMSVKTVMHSMYETVLGSPFYSVFLYGCLLIGSLVFSLLVFSILLSIAPVLPATLGALLSASVLVTMSKYALLRYVPCVKAR